MKLTTLALLLIPALLACESKLSVATKSGAAILTGSDEPTDGQTTHVSSIVVSLDTGDISLVSLIAKAYLPPNSVPIGTKLTLTYDEKTGIVTMSARDPSGNMVGPASKNVTYTMGPLGQGFDARNVALKIVDAMTGQVQYLGPDYLFVRDTPEGPEISWLSNLINADFSLVPTSALDTASLDGLIEPVMQLTSGSSPVSSTSDASFVIADALTFYKYDVFLDKDCSVKQPATVATDSDGKTTVAINDLSEGAYKFYVRVSDPDGDRATCASKPLDYVIDQTSPTTPASLSLVTGPSPGENTAVLAATGLEVGANVYVYSDSTCDQAVAGPVAITQAQQNISVTGLTLGAHNLYAKQVDVAGNASDCTSASVAVTVLQAPPGVPTGLTVTPHNGSVDLSWQAVSGADTYSVERSTNPTSGYAEIVNGLTGTTYTDTTASNGVTYYYKIIAHGPGGASAGSSAGNGTPQTPPTAPSNLTTTALSGTSLRLNWTDNSNNEAGFTVEKSADGGTTWSAVGNVGPNVTTIDATGLTAGQSYNFRVSATNVGGASGTTAGSGTPPLPPTTPQNPAAVAGAANIALSWDAVAGATSYTVRRSTTSGSGFTNLATNVSTNSYTDFTATNGTTFYYVIIAVNVGGSSSASAQVSGLPLALPAAPSGLTATPSSSTSVDLGWTDNSSNETGFVIERSTDQTTWTTIHTAAANATSYANTLLTTSQIYYYRIYATNGSGDSTKTSVVSATPPTAPAAPTGLNTALQSGDVILTWSAATDATSYTVKRGTSSGGPYTDLVSGLTATTYTDNAATLGVPYYYVVVAVGVGGSSGNSSQVTATPASSPSAPSALSRVSPAASSGTDSTPTLQVNGLTNGNEVQIFSNSSCTTAVSSRVTATSSSENVTLNAVVGGSYTFYALQIGAGDNRSACSTASVAYTYIDQTLTLAVASGQPTALANNGSSQTQLEAVLLDGASQPVNGTVITISLPTNGGSFTSTTATTNAQGKATFVLTSSTTRGSYNYQASALSGVLTSNTLSISFTACSGTALTNSPFANWSGSDPGGAIVICTKDQFLRIADGTTYHGVTPAQRLARNYSLEADIDLAGATLTPIGNYSTQFTGDFNGGDWTLSNVSMTASANNWGLFGSVGTAGVVRNLKVTVVGLTGGGYSQIGVVAGTLYGAMSGVQVRGASGTGTETISGSSSIGGLVGYFSGDSSTRIITNSSVKQLKVTATGSSLGGFVGTMGGGSILRSFSDVTVQWNGANGQTPYNVGGFVGNGSNGTITDAYSRSPVSYTTTSATPSGIGGFAGLAGGGSSNYLTLTNVYSTGSVCASGACGSSTNSGPFAGQRDTVSITNAYWDGTTSGWASSPVAYKQTTAELQNQYTFIQRADNAFNFVSVWRIPSGGGYPIFQWEEPLGAAITLASLFAGGDGSVGNPWQIATENQLRNMPLAYQVNTAALGHVYKLNGDITLTYPIAPLGSGSHQFNGTFDGQSHTINGLSMIATASDTALFGNVGTAGVIKDLTVTVTSIVGGGQGNIGAIAGTLYGKISNVHVRGVSGAGTEIISGSSSVGGLVGYFAGDSSTRTITNSSVKLLKVTATGSSLGGFVGTMGDGSILRSFSDVTVQWNGANGQTPYNIGGFVGNGSNGTITDAYSRSPVSYTTTSATPSGIGGFAGLAGGGYSSYLTLTNVYSTGSVCASGACGSSTNSGPFAGQRDTVSITNAYWDGTTSGWASSPVAYKQTTAELQNQYTFIQRADNAFNFVSVWRIPSGGGYPIFQWEEPLGAAITLASLFAGGDGSVGNPWQIATENQLRNMALAYQVNTAALSHYYKLNGNVALTYPIAALGSGSHQFAGSFDGQNYTISNLSMIATASDTALFGNVGTAGVIKDLTVTVTSIVGGGQGNIAAIAGTLYGKISNVHVRGVSGAGTETISGSSSVGGLVGYFAGDSSTRTITNSSVKLLKVTATGSSLGGFVGTMGDGSILRSFSDVTVQWNGANGQTPYNVGGFVGNGSNGTITDAYSRSPVSYTTTSATPSGIGGFAGLAGGGYSSYLTLTNVYSTGSVCASGACGSSTNSGPFAGQRDTVSITNAYWDGTTSGWASSPVAYKQTTAELQNKYTFIQRADNAFDFVNVWRIPSGGGYPIFQWQEPLGSPVTLSSLFAGGDGSSGDPWQVGTEEQLRNMALAYQLNGATLSHSYKLTGNVSLTYALPALGSGSHQFNGTFDGQNYTISNLSMIATSSDTGLFGNIGTSGVVRDLTVTVSSIAGGGYSNVGAIAGTLYGKITNVQVRGVSGAGTETISGASSIGGLVGYFSGDGTTRTITNSSVKLLKVTGTSSSIGGFLGTLGAGTIERSFSNVTVQWNGANGQTPYYVGGFVGNGSNGTITDAYSRSPVSYTTTSATPYGIGGFAGLAGGGSSSYLTLTNVYTTGSVCASGACGSSTNSGPFAGQRDTVSITNAYWDDTTSGWASSPVAYKRSTADLQDQYTFLQRADNAFNFITVWRIPSGGGYPIFQWEEPLGAAITLSSLFAGGDGSVGTPWQIANETQLRNMTLAYKLDNTILSKYFELTGNIALTKRINSLASSGAPFSGTFDGKEFTISNLQIDGTGSDVGLFGNISATGLVKDLNVTVTGINGNGNGNVGAIAGSVSGRLTNVHARGVSGAGTEVISGNNYVGGLVGYFTGDASTRFITNCSASQLTLNANGSGLGGLLGGMYGGRVQGSASIANTVRWNGSAGQTAYYVGGFVGNGASGEILNAYSTSNVSYATPSNTPYGIGGFAGLAGAGYSSYITITNAYSTGNVCGGNCGGSTEAGPFAGRRDTVTFTKVYWDIDTSGWASSPVGTGVADTDLQNDVSGNGIVDALDSSGWSSAIWELDPNVFTNTYPQLQWEL